MNSEYQQLKKLISKILQSKPTHGLSRVLRNLQKELTLFTNHTKSVITLNKQLKNKSANKIQIGGGPHLLKNFLNIDIVPPADLIWDVREGIPLPDNCAQLIFSEHFLEHLDYPTSVKVFINESFRILNNGGELIIGVPNAEQVITLYTKKSKKIKEYLNKWYSKRDITKDVHGPLDIINYVFRDQDDSANYTPHLWAYDAEQLTALLQSAGFTKIIPWKFNKSIANPKRQWRSIYLKAIK